MSLNLTLTSPAVTAATYTPGSNTFTPCDCTSNAIAMTLPPMPAGAIGLQYFKRLDATYNPAGGVTFTPSTGQTIADSPVPALTQQGATVLFLYDGVSKWYAV